MIRATAMLMAVQYVEMQIPIIIPALRITDMAHVVTGLHAVRSPVRTITVE
jgi:hypothetical protein